MLVHPQFDPIAIQIGPLAVRWYGLMYLIGFAAAVLLGRRRIRTQPASGITNRDLDDMVFYALFGVILGGRLGYVLFYKLSDYIANPLGVFAIWEGGMSFHGGFLGVLVAMALFCRKTGKSWLAVMDFVAPLCPLGLGAGRIGNFINAELPGRATDVPWAMVFPNVDAVPRHPSQLYEFALEGVVFFAPAVVVLEQTSTDRRGIGAVPDRLRSVPFRGRIHATTRRLSRFPRAWADDGPMAEPAHDRGGHRDDGLGLPTSHLKFNSRRQASAASRRAGLPVPSRIHRIHP